jgi:hypothetical protein
MLLGTRQNVLLVTRPTTEEKYTIFLQEKDNPPLLLASPPKIYHLPYKLFRSNFAVGGTPTTAWFGRIVN